MINFERESYLASNYDVANDPYLTNKGGDGDSWDWEVDFRGNPYYEHTTLGEKGDEIPAIEHLYEPTLEEVYADATPEELENLTKAAFYDGYWQYFDSLPNKKSLWIRRLDDKERLVLGSVRILAQYVHRNYGLPRPELSILERVQAANRHSINTTTKYKAGLGNFNSFILGKFLDREITREEEIGEKGLFSGGLIRVKTEGYNYHGLVYLKQVIDFKVGRILDLEEFKQFLNNPEEEIEFFAKHYNLIDRLEEHPELEDLADEDNTIDPEAVALCDIDGVESALGLLNMRQKRILSARLGLDGSEPQTLEELRALQEPPVTRERIRQIEAEALERLSSTLNIREIISGEKEL